MCKREALSVLIIVATLLLAIVCWAGETLTVTVPQANVREGPGLTHQVLSTVPGNATFPIIETRRGWHRILLDDGRKGWIFGSIVRLDKESRGIPLGQAARSLPLEQIYGKSWAVVIGIDAYSHPRIPRLHYAVNDARSVESALGSMGFPSQHIFTLVNDKATRRNIEQVLYERLRSAGKQDRLFVFFAGHGETQVYPVVGMRASYFHGMRTRTGCLRRPSPCPT